MSTNEGFGTTYSGGSTYPEPASQWAPPASPAFGSPAGTTEPTEPSTADVAKDKAASVAGGATDAAKNVAGVAKEQATQVATEAKKQVKDLVGQARTELSEQAGVQQQRVAGGLRSVGDQIRSMAEGSSEQGPAVDIAHQAADKVHEIAEFFENRDPGSVLEEVRSFARKQPGAFLAISLGAGILAGRLARGLTADTDEAPAASSGSLTSGSAVRPALGNGSGAQGLVPAQEWPTELGINR